ncbi:PQQ-binding-like beta-propeller repeat protein [Natrialbaceae archaeon AArc-T1-2]|uniref:outer membrane protein assembly factor BamB family protein n=1 Tax=Natrialbaceae archaeon AArc-T1-2 TaxID=3053904 RepID=UPI00255B0E59|nr:PQQ-binding-like beta-propeller repeat protein [Natrialbaceae archaeon AArc-T1-2]WIV68809.1 PQQ-binding-like beta-propeller repeat protein [Natrialbaceae archaeon AArc-T1-2]
MTGNVDESTTSRALGSVSRRLFCVTGVGFATAGCLNLEAGSGDGASAGDNGDSADDDSVDDDNEASNPPPVDEIDELSLSEMTTLERAPRSVGETDGVFLTRGFDGVSVRDPDGSQRWLVELPEEYRLNPGQTLTSDGERLYVGSRNNDGDDARLYAFDASDGTERWVEETDSTGTRTRIQHVTLADGAIVYGSDTSGSDDDQDSVIRALEAESGQQRWEHEYTEAFVFEAGSTDERVYAGVGNHVYVYELATGDVVDKLDIHLGFTGSVADDELFVGYDRQVPGELIALEMADGSERWREPFDLEPSGGLAIGSETVFVGTDAGYVVALDAETGLTRWQTRLDATISNPPVPDGNRVWVSDNTDMLSALAVVDGTVVYDTQLDGWSGVDVAVIDDVLLTNGTDTLYRIEGS